MIRNSKQNKSRVLIEYSDIMIGLRHSWKTKNEKAIAVFGRAFSQDSKNLEEIASKTYLSFSYQDFLIQYLLQNELVTNFEGLITRDELKDAFLRSYYEFNHEMRNKLKSYFRRFIDNEIAGKSNERIIQEILNDSKVKNYIKGYDNFDMFMEEKISKNIDLKMGIKQKNKVA